MPDCSCKHHSFFDLIVICDQFIQCSMYRLSVYFSQKPQRPEIDSQHWNFSVNNISGSLKKCTITAQNQNTLCSLWNQFRICIMVCPFQLTFRLLNLTFLSIFFQIRNNFICDLKIFIFITVCDDIKLIHLP